MGSKRAMLRNGLGELLSEQVPKKTRFFDLFCGAGSVSGFVAQNFSTKVVACDLQRYAVFLAAAQIEQTCPFSSAGVIQHWEASSSLFLDEFAELRKEAISASLLEGSNEVIRSRIGCIRNLCSQFPDSFEITRAYGGYYYSPYQSMLIDALLQTLPRRHKNAALAALISTASTCAAAPGHTAQPFGTKDSALPHLCAAWRKDIIGTLKRALEKFAEGRALTKGRALQSNAISVLKKMKDGDLAFIDPPYSEVQYSRFYHVLESIANGGVGPVSGVGRYPSLAERPQSAFCLVTQSVSAFSSLMQGVSEYGAEAIVTFPAGEASNGLSGEMVEQISDMFFHVKKRKIASTFSTLGGNSLTRTARKKTTELVLYLAPR